MYHYIGGFQYTIGGFDWNYYIMVGLSVSILPPLYIIYNACILLYNGGFQCLYITI